MTFLPLAEEFTFFDASGISGLGFLLVLSVLAFLAILVYAFSRVAGKIKNKKEKAEPVVEKSTPVVTPKESKPTKMTEEVVAEKETNEPEVPHIPGYVVLNGVSEQDAAVIMAITSFRTGIPLERLDFSTIKRLNQDPVLENVSEQDAAVIMAITSNKTGIPLENLAFNSIKLVEE